MAAAKDAGLDEHSARAEGEALAATIAEPSRGAFVDWSRETGRAESAQEFMDAASRGRRYRSAPTPSMAVLALDGSVHAASYAEALSDVAMAACSLGEDNPRAVGNAATAAAAQLRGPGTTSPSLALGTPLEPALGPTPEYLSQVMDQLGVVRKRIEGMEREALLDGSGGPSQRVPDQAPQATAPAPEMPAEPEEQKEPEPPAKTVEELLAELDALVGLADVKAEIHRQAAVLRVEGLRKDAGLRSPTITRHLIFDGNPGTGKTTVARLVAGIYRALGLLTEGTAGRGRPVRAGRRLPRPDRDQDRRGGRVRGRRCPLHRRGVLALRRPVRHRGHRHPGQGDGGQARRPGRDRGGLPGPDGDLHRARTPGSRAASARSSTSPTTPTTSWCRSSR